MPHTLNVETGGWIVVGLSSVIKTRHQDLQLLLAARHNSVGAILGSCVCGMPAGHDEIEHRVCAQAVLVFLAKGGGKETAAGRSPPAGEKHLRNSSIMTFALDCVTVGHIRWSMSVMLFSRESQITPVQLTKSESGNTTIQQDSTNILPQSLWTSGVNVHKATICTKHALPVFEECH